MANNDMEALGGLFEAAAEALTTPIKKTDRSDQLGAGAVDLAAEVGAICAAAARIVTGGTVIQGDELIKLAADIRQASDLATSVRQSLEVQNYPRAVEHLATLTRLLQEQAAWGKQRISPEYALVRDRVEDLEPSLMALQMVAHERRARAEDGEAQLGAAFFRLAEREHGLAQRMQVLTFLLGIGLVLVAGLPALSIADLSQAQHATLSLTLGLPVALLGVYTSRLASGHRRVERWASMLGTQMASLSGYCAPLGAGSAEGRVVRAEFAKVVFGASEDPAAGADVMPSSVEVVERLIKAVAPLAASNEPTSRFRSK